MADDFRWKSKAQGVRSNRCKPCDRAYGKSYYKQNAVKRRAEIANSNRLRLEQQRLFVRRLKEWAGCEDCHEDDPVVLEFDHLRDKKFNISMSIGTVSWRRLFDEIKKCDVVCANCHRRRTARRRSMKGDAPIL